MLPVLQNGQFVGVLERNDVLDALRPIYGERVHVVKEKELARA